MMLVDDVIVNIASRATDIELARFEKIKGSYSDVDRCTRAQRLVSTD